jgi:adenine-specific DNA-methyltransferase
VENAPDSDLWHTLIEADNYHALQLLEYLYAGKVDCIYIDPPYNTGAKDWKYNNDYVDGADSYRHSKWLSFMQRRLKLAKKLLNPNDSVLIVTIDEKEYLHLGCLLEEMFPEAQIQMITDVTNPKGVSRGALFSRAEEYIFFVFIGNAAVNLKNDDMLHLPKEQTEDIRWASLQRSGSNSRRFERPNLFYPIFFSKTSGEFVATGESLPLGVDRLSIEVPEDLNAVFPLGRNGDERTWQLSQNTLKALIEKGFVQFGNWQSETRRTISYLSSGVISQIENGEIQVAGYREDGSAILEGNSKAKPFTVWNKSSHSASDQGSSMISSILNGKRFTFPKSLYATHDALWFFVANKPNALILDFFAGSGTTLHAVNLLNAEDCGHRRCIMVTNNEVSADEARTLTAQGYKPGDEEWEKLGIARYVTWPRTVCSIEGHDVNGNPLKGKYIGSDIPMADGFKANCEYFKLGFLDRNRVSLGTQFCEILPLLWLKSGAIGKRPEVTEEPQMLILPENRFAVLVEEAAFAEFARQVAECGSIDTVYFVTNSETAFHEMSANIGVKNTHQLYREYIDNFVIGARRDAK